MAQKEHAASSTSIHAHGDGTYHTHSPARSCDGSCGNEPENESFYRGGGKRVDHESFGHAAMHMASKHAQNGHIHVEMHDEGDFTTHHVEEPGARVQGPQQHKSTAALKSAIGDIVNDCCGD